MENSFSREKHNPLELIQKWWPDADVSHIEYDPNMVRGYYSIIRQSVGDGTLLFTIQMMQEALLPLVNQQSFYKKNPPDDWSVVTGIKYKIGAMKHATVCGMMFLKCSKEHKYPGQRERVRIPVICEILTQNDKLTGCAQLKTLKER